MEFQVLGPVAALRDGAAKKLGGVKQRTLLGVLLADPGRTVSTDVLIDALYGESAPAGSRRSVQTFVSNLRRELGEVIVRDGEGYRVDSEAVTVDSVVFGDLVRRARHSLDADPADAAAVLRTALPLWRGRPFEDVDAHGHLESEIGRLEELRLVAQETRIEADLALGENDNVIAELESLTAQHPFRERFTCQLMLALYRSHRQAEALRACNRLRLLLVEELGIEPTADTRRLEQRILEQDPDLAVPSAHAERRTRSVGEFELRERIGQGRFSVVYRARQPTVARDVAVKVIRSDYAHDPEFLRRFEREAQLVAQLEHPHVVPVLDYWRDPDGAYVAMRLFRGGSLADALKLGPWTLDRGLRLIDQIAAALTTAHHAGILHRDVKPANILLDESGNGALGDFGIASIVGATTTFTDEGRTPTTPAYAAPEILTGQPYDQRCDVYSLGIVAYELLAGVHPFPAASIEGMVSRHIEEPLPALNPLHPEIPDAVDQVLAAATAKEPDQRTGSAAEFAADLRDAAGLHTVLSTGSASAGSQAERTPALTDFITDEMPFGPIAMDEISTRDVYEALYDSDNRIHREIVRRRPSFIVGRRGAGKTALMRAPMLDAHNLLVEFTSAELFSQVLSCVNALEARGASLFVKQVSDIWEGVVWSGLAHAVLQKSGSGDEARDDVFTLQRYVAGLGGNDLRSIDAAGAAFCRALVATDTAGLGPSLDSVTIGGVTPAVAKGACRRIMDAMELQPVVLIDSMEDLHTELGKLSRVLAGLFGLVGHAERSAVPECDFRLCYPSELWAKLADFAANPLKDAENHITLHWQAKELVKMAGNRLAIYLRLYHPGALTALFDRRTYNPGSYDDARVVLGSVLPKTVKNMFGRDEASLAYVMRHTQLLPRHLLWILNGVMRRNRELGGQPIVVSEEAVVDGVHRVEELLVSEVFSAYSAVHPQAREVCRRALPELPDSFTDGDLHRTYNRTGIAKKTSLGYFDFKELLVEIGAVGRVTGRTDRYVEGEFDYTMPTPLYPAHEDALCLHPVFARVFHATPGSTRGDEAPLPVYPYGSDPDHIGSW